MDVNSYNFAPRESELLHNLLCFVLVRNWLFNPLHKCSLGTNESRDGFFSGWNGSTPQNTPQCNHALSTLIFFECDQSANWDPRSPPSAKYVSSLVIDCTVWIRWGFLSLVPRLHSPAFLALFGKTQCEKSWGVHSARKAGEWSLGTRLGLSHSRNIVH